MLFCHVTSHIPTDPYPELLSEKGGRGFPTLMFLDADGNVIAKQQRNAVASFQKTLDEDVARYTRLVDLAATGDPDARRELLVERIELGHYADDVGAARRAMKGLEFDEDARAQIEAQLVKLEFDAVYTRMKSIDDAPDAGKKLLPMLEHGRIPVGRDATMFWFFLCKHAEAEKDAALLEKCLKGLRANVEHDRRARGFLPMLEASLAKLKS